jgi:hypothetical protein
LHAPATNKINGLAKPARPFFYGRSQNIRTEILQSNVSSIFIGANLGFYGTSVLPKNS